MSFVFRGTRADLEGGLSGFMPERRSMAGHRFHGTGRSVNANPMPFLVTVLLLFMIFNSHQLSQNLMLWVGLVVFLLASSLRMYAMCHQLQVQAQAAAVAASAGGLLTHAELRLHYDALRALDADNPPGVTAMSETDISRLPVRMYKGAGSSQTPETQMQPGRKGEDQLPSDDQVKVDIIDFSSDKVDEGKQKVMEEELTCSVCLEQVVDGEIVRTLPCVHQFHSACIDQWLRQQATCPVCKFRLNGPETPSARTPTAAAFMA